MSYFQSLPTNIIETIIDYAFATYTFHHNYVKDNAWSLLHSCQAWRAGYLKRACKAVSLSYGYSGIPDFKYDMCPHRITPLSLPLSQYAKTFTLNMQRPRSIANGDAIRWIQESGAANLEFTYVHTLTVNFGYFNFSNSSDSETLSLIQNIESVLHYARKTAPNVQKISFSWSIDCSPDMSSECQAYLNKTITYFFCGLHAILFKEEAHFSRTSQLLLETLPDLTHFSYVFSPAHTWFVELIRRSSKTLKVLEANSLPKSKVEELIYSDTFEPIIYPRLEVLDIQSVYNNRNADEELNYPSPDCQVVHFPSLKRLHVSGIYPFSDNVLARNENTTLEYLNLSNITVVDECIRAYQSLHSSQFYNLKYLIVNTAFHKSRQLPQDSHLVYSIVSFLKEVVPMFTPIYRLELKGSINFSQLYDGLSKKSLLDNMRHLVISNIISFMDIVTLLQSAPYLCSLKCGLNTRLPIEYECKQVDLRSFIKQTFHRLGCCANSFEFFTFQSRNGEYLSKVAILLTIGCPNLLKIRFTDSEKCIVAKSIAQAAQIEPFKEYFEPCRRALKMFQ